MSKTTLNLSVLDFLALESELTVFLTENINQYQKFKINENLVILEGISKPYYKVRKELFEQLSEFDPATKNRSVPEFIKEGDDYIPNPNFKKFKDELSPIEEEKREVTLTIIDSSILKKLTSNNHYKLLFQHLIKEEGEEAKKD